MKNIFQFKTIFLLSSFSLLLYSCNKPKGYKTESGLIFYVYNNNANDSTPHIGDVVKLNIKKYVNDSLVENTYNGMPKYEQVMPGLFYPYEAGEIYPFFRKGDSIKLIQEGDSLLKRRLFNPVASYVSPGDQIITYFKVLDVFSNDSIANVDMNGEFPKAIERNRKNGAARIQTYLDNNGIKAELTPDTVFIEMIKEGDGSQIDAGDKIQIRFTAQTMSGNVFGSNTNKDNSPLEYEVMSGYMPNGIDQSLTHLQVGDHARFYLPAMKAFGPSPPPGLEEGFQDLIFEVEVLSKNLSAQ